MNRKDFIKSCGSLCLGGMAMMAVPGCSSSNHFAQSTTSGDLIAIAKSEFIKMEKDKSSYRKFVLTRSGKFNQPICLFRFDENNYSALLMLCTHNGCELLPQGDFLICPCHGSEFSNKGIVQNPPAENNLQSFKISTNHETVFIHL